VWVAFLQHVEDFLRRLYRSLEANLSSGLTVDVTPVQCNNVRLFVDLVGSADRWLSQATTLKLPWYQPAFMQQGDEPGFSRTMRRHMRESWDSTAFYLFVPFRLPLSMRPSRTPSLVISAKETDGWILHLFTYGPGSSRDRCRFAFLDGLPVVWKHRPCPFYLLQPFKRRCCNVASWLRARSLLMQSYRSHPSTAWSVIYC